MIRQVRKRAKVGCSSALCVLAVLTLIFGNLQVATAEDLAFDEYEIKAAYLYHFSQFITWPGEENEPEGSPLVLAILGEDPFGRRIDVRLKDRRIRGRNVEVRRFATLEDLRPCHILFVPESESPRLKAIVSRFVDASTLLVGESSRFAEKGGMIGFHLESDAVRFQINTERASSVGLEISSRLLNLATIVEDDSKEIDNP